MADNNSSSEKHIDWIDYARGIAILSVVLLHVNGGIIGSGISTPSLASDLGFGWETFSLRLMPVFFLISGAFAVRSLVKGRKRFILNRSIRILYPYVLWSMITLAIGTILVRYTNYGLTLWHLPQILYEPVMHYWFLYALFVISFVYALMSKLEYGSVIFFVLTVVYYTFGEAVALEKWNYILGQIGQFGIFFSVGTFLGRESFEKVVSLSTPILLAAATFALGLFIAIFIMNSTLAYTYVWRIITAPSLLIGVVMLSVFLERYDLFSFIQHWGRLSLEIYLAHVLVLAGVRIILSSLLSIDSWATHFILGSVMAIYVPIFLAEISRKLDFYYLFEWQSISVIKPTGQQVTEVAQIDQG